LIFVFGLGFFLPVLFPNCLGKNLYTSFDIIVIGDQEMAEKIDRAQNENMVKDEIEALDAEKDELLASLGYGCSALFFSKKKFSNLPKVFIDGRTGVLISIDSITNIKYCTWGLPNCAIYENNLLYRAKGIFFIEDKEPIASIFIEPWEAEKIFKNFSKLKENEKINEVLKNQGKKLLIIYDYDDKSIKIYERFGEVEKLLFPSRLETDEYGDNLYIARVPKIDERIPYEEIDNLMIYSYKIKFTRKVIRFKINSINGKAELIFNPNDEGVTAFIKYDGCDEWHLEMEPHKLYLFTHRRPHWAREE